MQTRRLIALCVVVILILSMVVACGGTKSATPRPTAVVSSTQPAPKPMQEAAREPCILASSGPLAGIDPRGQTVVWWHTYSGSQEAGGRRQEAGLKTMVDAFNADNACGITVVGEHQGSDSDIRDKMSAGLSVGALPGLTLGARDDQTFYALVHSLADLNVYIADKTWGLSPADQQDFFAAFLKQSAHPIFDGQRLGFPADRAVDVLFYNQTWLEKLGFSGPPTTTETFKGMACAAAKVKDAEGYILRADASVVTAWTYAFGGDILNPNGVRYSFNNEAAVQAMTFLKELTDQGCAVLTADEVPAAHFAARRALFVQGPSADLPIYQRAMEAAGSTDVWGVTAIPHTTPDPVQHIYGSDFMIPATNPETQLAAWAFLKWFTAPEQQAAWIAISGQFPTRASVAGLLNAEEVSPQWFQALDVLRYGVHAPQLISYPSVRDAAQQALSRIMQGDDIKVTLNKLNLEANFLQEEQMKGIALPKTKLCAPAESGPLAGIDPRGQTVVWQHAYSGSRAEVVQTMIEAFNTANECNITVVAESLGSDEAVRDKMNAGIATGKWPGLTVGNQNDQAAYAHADGLADLNPYIADPDWGLTNEERSDFYAAFLAQGVHSAFEGQRFGFPLARSVEVLFYNQTWLAKLRYAGPPTTIEAFKAAACAVTKAKDAAASGVSGYMLRADAAAIAGWTAAFGGISPAGGAILNAAGDGYAYNAPSAVAALTFLKKLYDEKCAAFLTTDAPSTAFAARRALFSLGSSADIPLYQQAMEAAKNTDVWGVTTLPYSATAPASIVYGSDFIIPATNPETQLAAWVFIQWCTAPEQQVAWIHVSGDVPTRASVAGLLDAAELLPQQRQAVDALRYGVYEPQLISYPSVRDAAQNAFNQILQGVEAQPVLDRLTREANALQKKMME